MILAGNHRLADTGPAEGSIQRLGDFRIRWDESLRDCRKTTCAKFAGGDPNKTGFACQLSYSVSCRNDGLSDQSTASLY